MIPLSLYIHYPWCVRKCPYCDFNSHQVRSGDQEAPYLAALERDLRAAATGLTHRPIQTIFIGGGTPSLISVDGLGRMLALTHRLLDIDSDAEITLEANPGAIDIVKFRAFRDLGINRLSIGIQSFDNQKLLALGRIHDRDEAFHAIEQGLQVFERVNIDLMYGLPGQTLAEAELDIQTAIQFQTGHISAYHLSIEPNTAFAHQPPTLPDEDCAADMQEMVEARLAEAGYQLYEISAFAFPGQQCRHNLNYWTFGDYLGIGPGAHGKLTEGDAVYRERRHAHPKAYMESESALDSCHRVTTEELPAEFMMNALRLLDGFNPALFADRTGLPLTVIEPILASAEAEDLIVRTPTMLKPTTLGRRYLNSLVSRFL